MNTETFIDFVMKQSPNRRIDHSSGWGSCSYGDYVREVLGEDFYPDNYCFHHLSEPENILPIIGNEYLCETLNNVTSEFTSYGKLQKFISENQIA